MESLVKDQIETANCFFTPVRKHCVESQISAMYFGAQSNININSGRQCSRNWYEWNENLLQRHTSVCEPGNGCIMNGLSSIMCSFQTPISPNYQETSITANRRARFNLHVIATQAGCAAVNKGRGGSGISEASVCSSLTCGLTCF